MTKNVPWTEENIKALIKARSEGVSYSKLATFFGKSRNAIASAVRHYCLKKVAPQKTAQDVEAEVAGDGEAQLAPLISGALTVKRMLTENRKDTVSYPDPRFLTKGYCRAIIGDPKDLVCCGKRISSLQIYCAEHKALYYEKPRDPCQIERLAKVFK